MSSRVSGSLATHLLALSFLIPMVCPVNAFAQGDEGIVLGRVFEIDKKKYQQEEARADEEGQESDGTTQSEARADEGGEESDGTTQSEARADEDGEESDGTTQSEARADEEGEESDGTTQSEAGSDLRPSWRLEEYLEPRSNVEVIARLLENNQEFRSAQTGGGGDYLISNLSPGVFEFTLRFEDQDYPVAQRLDAKVNLTFLAELCFVLDKEEQVAWMVAAGPRRSPDIPMWVPEQCQSQLSACLGSITDEEDFRKGLLLIFAGSGAAATGIGIAATREEPASPLERP